MFKIVPSGTCMLCRSSGSAGTIADRYAPAPEFICFRCDPHTYGRLLQQEAEALGVNPVSGSL